MSLTGRLPAVRWTLIIAALALLAVAARSTTRAETPGNADFQRTWARTDQPVADGYANRTWMWGPQANGGVVSEPYAEAPNGQREVQYFDKSRMEITHPAADGASDPGWYVTNGLLVTEMVSGQIQTGDTTFQPSEPAAVNVAGDADDPSGPTYATIAGLTSAAPLADGAAITQRLTRAGQLADDTQLANYGVTAAYRLTVPGLDHQIASPFWAFMNASGTVYQDGAYSDAPLFQNPFYATGYPLTEASWATVKVAGADTLVLLQCFQRRCLTYTPDNPAGWQVEAGNVGLHYHAWRFGAKNDGNSPTATATATPSATVTGPTSDEAACLNAEESGFLTLINAYRAQHGLTELTASAALDTAAYLHSLDMGERNYFDHFTPLPLPPGQSGPSPADRMRDAGYAFSGSLAENIAAGYASAQAAFDAFKDSPEHNANMLRPEMRAIGIGRAVVEGSEYTTYWTTDFGDVSDAQPGC